MSSALPLPVALLSGALLAGPTTAEVVDTIKVVGSHVRSAAAVSAAPVSSLDREELNYRGSPTILDLILDLPFSQGADGESDRFQGGGGSGVGPDRATINIRGLGPSRTLTLLNGRRTAWSPMATGQDVQLLVDVNMLPGIALQNVDFLRDGAAASYGSDALAGVVNFITRSDFTGLEFSANHKLVDGSSGDTELGLIGGLEFGGNRGHIMAAVGGIRRSELEIYKRDWALRSFQENPKGGWSSTGRPATFVPGNSVNVSADGIIDPNCAALGGAPTTSNKRCRFQYTPFDNLVEKTRRWQGFSQASWTLTETLSLKTEMLYSKSEAPDWNTSPSYPPNKVVDPTRSIRAGNPALVDMALKYPDIYGQYAHCDDKTRCQWSGGAWDEVGWALGRSYGQDGPLRAEPVVSDVYRLVIGLDGELDNLDFSISAAWSEATRRLTQGDTMSYRDKRALQGLGGIDCERQTPNQYVDGSLHFDLETLQQYAGKGDCKYWSPFSNGMYGAHPQVPDAQYYTNPDFNPDLDNRELFDYLLTERIIRGNASLLTLEGMVQGILPLRLRGAQVGFALGTQWRRETYSNGALPGALNDGAAHPCPNGPGISRCPEGERTGLFGYLPLYYAVAEQRNVYAVFGELQLPLSDRLDAQLSLRYEEYGGSTGGTLDPKLALRWEPLDDLTLRGSAGTSLRAPTLNQTISGNTANGLQYVAATGAFKSLIIEGDPALAAEEAFTFNVGMTFDRNGLLAQYDNAGLSLDYWSYQLSKPLVVEPFDRVLALACPDGNCAVGDPNYLQRIRFGQASSLADLQAIRVKLVNGPDIDTDGLDFSAHYRIPAGAGELTFKVTGTRILSYKIGSWALGNAYNALGRMNRTTSLARTLTRWKALGHVNYSWRNINLRYLTRFTSAYDNVPDNIRVAAHQTHDLYANWTVQTDRLSVWAALVNLTDADPPYAGEDLNYDAFSHSPLGRVFKLGFTYSF